MNKRYYLVSIFILPSTIKAFEMFYYTGIRSYLKTNKKSYDDRNKEYVEISL